MNINGRLALAILIGALKAVTSEVKETPFLSLGNTSRLLSLWEKVLCYYIDALKSFLYAISKIV